MHPRTLILLGASGSAALLAGAFFFQYGLGLFPCALCIWQRWPHAIAILLGLIGIKYSWRSLAILGALAAFTSAAIGGFHVGVEQGWWSGLESCGGAGIADLSLDALLDPTVAAPEPVRCDKIAWSFLGLSMAAWNMLASSGLGLIWLRAARRP